MLRLIRDIMEFKPLGRETSIRNALVYLTSLIKKKAVVFLISDFLDDQFATALKIASRKHDPRSPSPSMTGASWPSPPGAISTCATWKTAKNFNADFSDGALRREFQKIRDLKSGNERSFSANTASTPLVIHSDRDYEKPFFDLFLKRKKNSPDESADRHLLPPGRALAAAQVSLSVSTHIATIAEPIELRVVVRTDADCAGVKINVPAGAYEIIGRSARPVLQAAGVRTRRNRHPRFFQDRGIHHRPPGRRAAVASRQPGS